MIISLYQHFEADIVWKVSLKILNSGLILKIFTHAFEWHSGCGLETSIVTEFAGSLCDEYQNHMYWARLNTSTCKTENMDIMYK